MKFALIVHVKVPVRATDWIGVSTCTKALPGALLAVSYLVSNYKLQFRQVKSNQEHLSFGIVSYVWNDLGACSIPRYFVFQLRQLSCGAFLTTIDQTPMEVSLLRKMSSRNKTPKIIKIVTFL